MDRVDIITGTLGKALGGASGGFTSGKKEIIEMLRQRSRPYLFSNSLAPHIVGASIAVFDMLSSTTELRDKLETLGAEVLELPLISITKDVARDAFVEILSELGQYDWIVFTSANGVRFFFEDFLKGFQDIRALGMLRFACVGAATAREIQRHNIRVECMPDTATGASLADALIATGSMDSAKVIVVTGNLNRDTMVKKLEAARAIVDKLPLYKTEKVDLSSNPVADDFRQKGADAILFASSSAAQSFYEQSPALQLERGAKKPLLGSIGPQTTETMDENDMSPDFEAKKPSLDALIEAMIEKLSGKQG